MYSNPELEKITKEYLKKARIYESKIGDKSIDELKKLKQQLTPNLFQYFQAIFDSSDYRFLKLSVLEKVIKEKENKLNQNK